MTNKCLPVCLIISLGLLSNIFSQIKDSVKTYKLDEITVKAGMLSEPEMITQINTLEIEKSDAAALSGLGKFIPSVKLQTNSRGESLFYLRGSGERQLSLFFDGVPLNIPWDNRIDLSLIPTDAVGELSLTRGIPSIIYGANTLAGVVNVYSRETKTPGGSGKLSLQFGENNFQKYSGFVLGSKNDYSYLLSLSYKKTDGYSLRNRNFGLIYQLRKGSAAGDRCDKSPVLAISRLAKVFPGIKRFTRHRYEGEIKS